MSIMKFISRAALVLTAFLLPASASASVSFGFIIGGGPSCASTICNIASTIIYTINNVLVPLLFAIAFLVFLYGVFKKYIWSRGNETDVDEGHKLILWGIIGFVVMISLWGLVNVVANTFGLAGVSAPVLPKSY